MPILRIAAPLFFVCHLAAAVASAAAQAPTRIETAIALAQIVKKVEPEVPPEAVKAQVGGTVIADVTIGTNGTVSSVTILDGAPMLRAAAERAFRQWTFTPFVVRGKPAVVQVILEVNFPDRVKEAEQRIFESYRSTRYDCQRLLELKSAGADAACATAVKAADALPGDRVLERFHAIADHARALLAGGRTQDAVALFEKALAMRAARVKRPNADTADLQSVLALLYEQLGEFTKADAAFADAIQQYTAAAEQLPTMRESYAPRLKLALSRYAALKRKTGDAAAGAALDARAERVDGAPSSAPSRPVPITTRTIGTLQIREPGDARLTEDDIQQLRAALGPAGSRAWRLELIVFVSPPGERRVDAFLEPEVATSTFRRGRYAFLTTAPPPGTRETRSVWRRVEGNFLYIQVSSAGADAAASHPIRVQAAPNSPPPSDAEFSGIVQTIREHAVPQPTNRLMSDTQPWPITDLIVHNERQVRVMLADPSDSGRSQTISLRRTDYRWTIAEMQALGERGPR